MQQMIQAPSLGDLIVGGLLVVNGIMMRAHFIKKQPEKKGMRLVCIAMMIIGFALILWNPMFSLAKLNS
jgi:hypothetical protein